MSKLTRLKRVTPGYLGGTITMTILQEKLYSYGRRRLCSHRESPIMNILHIFFPVKLCQTYLTSCFSLFFDFWNVTVYSIRLTISNTLLHFISYFSHALFNDKLCFEQCIFKWLYHCMNIIRFLL